jgi:hypothetical protein
MPGWMGGSNPKQASLGPEHGTANPRDGAPSARDRVLKRAVVRRSEPTVAYLETRDPSGLKSSNGRSAERSAEPSRPKALSNSFCILAPRGNGRSDGFHVLATRSNGRSAGRNAQMFFPNGRSNCRRVVRGEISARSAAQEEVESSGPSASGLCSCRSGARSCPSPCRWTCTCRRSPRGPCRWRRSLKS